MANSPHDALFRYTFGQPEHAAPLLRGILPAGVVRSCDWSTLTLRPGTRLDRKLQRRQTDLLFAVRAGDDEVLIVILVEHLSRRDRWATFRLLEYAMGVWRQELRQRPGPRWLPPIVPVIVHHGRRRWSAPLEFCGLLTPVQNGEEILRQPRFRCLMRSLVELSPEQLEGLTLSLLGQLTLAMMQTMPGSAARDVAVAIRRWGGLIERLLRSPSGSEAMAALSEYVLTTSLAGPDALIEIV